MAFPFDDRIQIQVVTGETPKIVLRLAEGRLGIHRTVSLAFDENRINRQPERKRRTAAIAAVLRPSTVRYQARYERAGLLRRA